MKEENIWKRQKAWVKLKINTDKEQIILIFSDKVFPFFTPNRFWLMQDTMDQDASNGL